MSDPVKPELSRAWENYFGQRGGASPDAPAQVLPVVIMDDGSKGPYPACRIWQAAAVFVPQAGVYPKIGLKNVDGFPIAGGLLGLVGGSRSVVVVEEVIMVRDATVGGDFYANVSHHNLADMDFDSAAADDLAPEKDPTSSSTQPGIGGVHVGLRQTGLLVGNAQNGRLPGFCDGLSHTLTRSYCLGPGQILYIQRDVVNTAITVSFRGRYYPAP